MEISQIIKNKKFKPIVIVLMLIFLSIGSYIYIKSGNVKLVNASKFNKLLESKEIKKIFIQDNYIYLNTQNAEYKTPLSGVNKSKILQKYPVEIYTKSSSFLIKIAILILLLILFFIVIIVTRSSSPKNSITLKEKDNSHNLDEDITPEINSNISFKDVAGVSEVKEDLEEIINFLKNPLRYQKLNIRMPKGVLLVGPPGVGKTLIAKAISSEANVPFFYQSGANFVQIYAGMGAKRVKELFNKAKQMSPSIIFIDEIDSVGKDRSSLNSDERESTLNQLLIEIDGFSSNSGVIVIAATNRIDVLDSALLRPGRFDRRIFIDLPNLKEREQIINLYLKNKKHKIDSLKLAKMTAGFSPATIETLINEASLNAIKENKNILEFSDIEKVRDKVVYGKKRVPILTKKEREIQSYYQAAKGVIAIWQGFKIENIKLLNEINIESDNFIISKEYLPKLSKVYLCGSLYLQKEYNDLFNIGIEDRERVNKIIDDITNKYSLNYNIKKAEIVENLKLDLENELNLLDNTIKKVASILQESEQIGYETLKKIVDEIF